MVGTRALVALLGLGVSVALSAALWYVFDVPFVFLFLPFVPFFFLRRGGAAGATPKKRCPVCGYETQNPSYDHCPRDGTELIEE